MKKAQAMTEPKQPTVATATLGSDIVAWLVRGLKELDSIPANERDATIGLLWNADLVVLHFNGGISSLAARAKER